MPDKLRISFSHMGDYHMPIRQLLMDWFPEAEVFPAPPITQKTVELGAKNSPDFVCSPFKYNMGNFIEALEAGANVLFQTGLGCRYGYYGEVQEQILRDMGYDVTFLCLSREKARLHNAYGRCKALNPKLTYGAFLRALLRAAARIRSMDRLDFILRERIGFEAPPGAFARAKKAFLQALAEGRSLPALYRTFRKYEGIYEGIETRIPEHPLRVGIIGELYTLMEPFSNHHLERQLARAGAVVSRRMSVSFLLFGRRERRFLQEAKGYLRHNVGANGLDSVAQCRRYADLGYDGVIHMKAFGCAPELSAQPALMTLSRDRGIPILHLSFDTQTSETGLQTRIEAFVDMISRKRERNNEESSQLGGGRGLHLHERCIDRP